MVNGEYQNNIDALPDLNIYRYERIFKLYKTKNSQYFYNLLQFGQKVYLVVA